MEPLVELPIDQWPLLQEKLKALWPLNVAGFYSLQLNLKHPQVRDAFGFKVYCPYGDMANGFVSINVKNKNQDCIVFSIDEDIRCLEEALVNTKLIDWKKTVCIDLVSSLILKSLVKIRPVLGLQKFNVGKVKTYYLDKSSKPFDLSLPQHTYIAPIKKELISHIDDVWPYKFDGSNFYFSVFASNGLSFGLYSKEELLAWIFLNEYNFLLHLYCEEKHRRKGYAEHLLKHLVNLELGKGNDVYAYVEEKNEKPKALFEKLGFQVVDDGAYIMVQK